MSIRLPFVILSVILAVWVALGSFKHLTSDWSGDTPVVSHWLKFCLAVGVIVSSVTAL